MRSLPMLASLQTSHVGPAPHLRLDFAPRLNLITGDNGLGKTFILDLAWYVLTGSWNGYAAWVSQEAQSTEQVRTIEFLRRGDRGNRVITSEKPGSWSSFGKPSARPAVLPHERSPAPLVIYVLADGGVSVWDPTKGQNEADEPGSPFNPGDVYHFTPESLWQGLSEKDRLRSEGLLRDWVRWQYRYRAGEPSPFPALAKVLEMLSPPGEKIEPDRPIYVFPDEPREIPTIRMPYGVVPIIFAAAGIRRILSLAYILVWSFELSRQPGHTPAHNAVILFDEVEAHLHPRWQRALLPALLESIRALGDESDAEIDAQIIASTHAPLVLASVENQFSKADRFFTLRFEDGSVILDSPTFAKQGDVSAWLTSEIFGLEEARSLEAQAAIHHARAFMRGERYALPEHLRSKEALHRELVRVLPGDDPFWPRWIVRHIEKEQPR